MTAPEVRQTVGCANCGNTNGPWGRREGKLWCEACLEVPREGDCGICGGCRQVAISRVQRVEEWNVGPCPACTTGWSDGVPS